jgi:short-subunit dehydrogenase
LVACNAEKVIIVSRRKAELERVRDEINQSVSKELCNRVEIIEMDLSNPEKALEFA